MNLTDAERLFHEALALLTTEEQAAFLKGACRDNCTLRLQVEDLLAAHQQNRLCLLVGRGDRITITTPSEGPGTVIGRYKLLQQIGEGGMGVVYIAEQSAPVIRKVALKLIKLGMDTRQVVARFEAERQALALMNHPNIAKVLDGGATETGRPYFVMELVRGIPITEYCDRNHLSTRQRLELFLPVCQAVQHAHQKGIIHRDLKPSNILVTLHDGQPSPVVIDFGVAKALHHRLTEKTLSTHIAQMIGTPAYMSPEQAEVSQLDVDTGTDIYSLGVLLYELLTGTTPFSSKELLAAGYGAMQRIIAEQEPPRPSTRLSTMHQAQRRTVAQNRRIEASALTKLFQGDLDWIVMKCLEKERGRRYDTANALAADLQRHLGNEPVNARPPTTAYRLQKAVRRHRTMFVASAAVLLALVVGLAVASWEALRATLAEREQARLREQAELAAASEATARQVAVAARMQAEEATKKAEGIAARRRQDAYAAEMRAAQIALESGNLGQCRKLLLKYLPEPGEDRSRDLRGFEWRYLWQGSGSEALEDYPMGSPVAGASVSPDGRWVAAAGENGQMIVIERASRKRVYADQVRPSAPAFSPDGGMLAYFSSNAIQLVSVGNWKPLHSLSGEYSTLDFSRRAQILAAASPARATVWKLSATNGEPTARELPVSADRGLSLAAPSIRCTPDGNKVFIGDFFHGIHVFDVESQRLLRSVSDFPGVKTVAVSPDGRLLAASAWSGKVGVWLLPELTRVAESSVAPSYPMGVAFSPDGKILATGGSDQRVKLWRLPQTSDGGTLAPLVFEDELQGHQGRITCLSYTESALISGSADGTVRIWPITTPAGHFRDCLHPPGNLFAGENLWSSQDGSQLWMLGTDQALVAWNLPGGGDPVERVPLPADFPRLETSADLEVFLLDSLWHRGALFYCRSDGWACRFSPETRQNLRLFRLAGAAPTVHAVVTNRGVGYLVSATRRDHVHLTDWGTWDIRSGASATGPWAEFRAQAVPEANPYSKTVAQSPDGRWIAQAEGNSVLALWNATSEQRGARLRTARTLYHMAFSSDSRLLATGFMDGTARVWDVSTGQPIGESMGGSLSGLYVVHLTADGNTLLAGSDDSSVRMYSVASGQEMILIRQGLTLLREVWDFTDAGIAAWRGPFETGHPAYLPLPTLAEIDAEIATTIPGY